MTSGYHLVMLKAQTALSSTQMGLNMLERAAIAGASATSSKSGIF
jgi:hypothetical protein